MNMTKSKTKKLMMSTINDEDLPHITRCLGDGLDRVKDPDNHANRFNGKCLFPVNGDEVKGFNTGYGFTDFFNVLKDCNVFKESFKDTGVSFL